MKQIFKIVSVSVTILLIILASCSVAFANTPAEHHSISIQKPTVSDSSGYIEWCAYTNSSYYYFAGVIVWSFFPTSTSEGQILYETPTVSLDCSSTVLTLTLRTAAGTSGVFNIMSVDEGGVQSFKSIPVSYSSPSSFSISVPSNCEFSCFHTYGSYYSFGNLNNYRYPEFFITYSESSVISADLLQLGWKLDSIAQLLGNDSYSSQLYDILDELYDLNFTLENSDATLSEIKQNLTTKLMQLYNIGQTILGELEKITSNTDQLDAWLEEINLRLGTLYSGIDELSDWLDSINIQLIELKGFLYEMWLVDLDSNSKLYEILDTLNAILSNLEAYSDVKFPEHNGGNVDELVSKEDELLDDSEVDVSDALDVQVNPEAMTSVLGIVERVFNLHPKIIGLIVTILGLGLIALILGR